jgi:hypothetical protein
MHRVKRASSIRSQVFIGRFSRSRYRPSIAPTRGRFDREHAHGSACVEPPACNCPCDPWRRCASSPSPASTSLPSNHHLESTRRATPTTLGGEKRAELGHARTFEAVARGVARAARSKRLAGRRPAPGGTSAGVRTYGEALARTATLCAGRFAAATLGQTAPGFATALGSGTSGFSHESAADPSALGETRTPPPYFRGPYTISIHSEPHCPLGSQVPVGSMLRAPVTDDEDPAVIPPRRT